MTDQVTTTTAEVRDAFARDELSDAGEESGPAYIRGGYKFDVWLGFELRRMAAIARHQALSEAQIALSKDGYFCPAVDAMLGDAEDELERSDAANG
jgi:hypothetical protein